MDIKDRYIGALVGLACGDAVGTTVEFSPRGSFAPVTDMIGGGPFGLKPGQWTDDTSMALCLAESLLSKGKFDALDQMARYGNWWQWGYLSSTGDCFDIGTTVQRALLNFRRTGEPFSGQTDEYSAGNGSLMRLAPVVLFSFPDMPSVLQHAADSSRTTHGALEAVESCQLFATLLHAALSGTPKDKFLPDLTYQPTSKKLIELASGAFLSKSEQHIKGSGYCIESIEAALWCFFNTNSYREAVLRAVNLGDDADTTGAIVGQLAGAYYGINDVPQPWVQRLAMREDIVYMAEKLHERFYKNQ